MMRWWFVVGLVGCGAEEEPLPPPECVNPALEAWCFHDPAGPVEVPEGEICEAQTFTPGPNTSQCGDYDVIGSGNELEGSNLYFDPETGELAAVAYWTEDNSFCGKHVYWYGEEIHCY